MEHGQDSYSTLPLIRIYSERSAISGSVPNYDVSHLHLPDYSVDDEKRQRLIHSPWFATIRIALGAPFNDDEEKTTVAQGITQALLGRNPLVGIEPDALVTMFAVAHRDTRAIGLARHLASATHSALVTHKPKILYANVISYRPSGLLQDLQQSTRPQQGPSDDALYTQIDLMP